MAEETNMSEIVSEIKNATEDELRGVVEQWFRSTRADGMKIGAQFISAAIGGAIQQHLKKSTKPSLRDYQRCIGDITKIISIQLTKKSSVEETEAENDTPEEGDEEQQTKQEDDEV